TLPNPHAAAVGQQRVDSRTATAPLRESSSNGPHSSACSTGSPKGPRHDGPRDTPPAVVPPAIRICRRQGAAYCRCRPRCRRPVVADVSAPARTPWALEQITADPVRAGRLQCPPWESIGSRLVPDPALTWTNCASLLTRRPDSCAPCSSTITFQH